MTWLAEFRAAADRRGRIKALGLHMKGFMERDPNGLLLRGILKHLKESYLKDITPTGEAEPPTSKFVDQALAKIAMCDDLSNAIDRLIADAQLVIQDEKDVAAEERAIREHLVDDPIAIRVSTDDR